MTGRCPRTSLSRARPAEPRPRGLVPALSSQDSGPLIQEGEGESGWVGSPSAPFPGHPGELDAVAMGCRHTTQPVLGSLGCYCEATHWLASAADTCLPQFWMLWSEMRVLGALPLAVPSHCLPCCTHVARAGAGSPVSSHKGTSPTRRALPRDLTSSFQYLSGGFPGGSVVKNPPANAGDTGPIPDLGRFHVAQSNEARAPQLLNLPSRAQEPQFLSPHAATTEARVS